MQSQHRTEVRVIFGFISMTTLCIAFIIGSFLSNYYYDTYKFFWLILIFMLPFAVHSIAGFSLMAGWFDIRHHSTDLVISLMKMTARLFALFAFFDLFMRITQHTDWMMSSILPFIGDVGWLTVAFFWTIGSKMVLRE